ncbi:MAG: STAS-like domain-containing protein [Pseudanabaena sp. Salubria-1]|nr:STAS-like domain-containing protein [Pseudanabaena sp. Salubria-1]
MLFKVYKITGKFATDPDSGQKLYDLIHPYLVRGEAVQLDFTDVTVFASAFFNYAIGALLRDITLDDLNHLLTFKTLPNTGMGVLKRVITRAKQYYSDAQYQKAVDTVIEEYAASC